ncbi:MAG: chemotaxis protein CheB [Pedobacter sp.]|nr:chemotaxis protein CheB [Pedobacter sp.]
MNKNFFTVGIGASAGGLQSLKIFFDEIRSDLPVAFVVVTHLSRDYTSLLNNLLMPHTNMDVIRVEKDMDLIQGNIYILIENKTIKVKEGRLIVTTRDAAIVNSAVDIFFESLAKDFGRKAVGIILSGGGSDGLEGSKLINKMGGNVMVQDPESAQADGMPFSIIRFDHPVAILNPKELAQRLNRLCAFE